MAVVQTMVVEVAALNSFQVQQQQGSTQYYFVMVAGSKTED
jgi:hypothetical protein